MGKQSIQNDKDIDFLDENSQPTIDEKDYEKAMEVLDTNFHNWCHAAHIPIGHIKDMGVGGDGKSTLFFCRKSDGTIVNRLKAVYNEKGKMVGSSGWMKNPPEGEKYGHALFGQHRIDPTKTTCLTLTATEAIIGAWKYPGYNWVTGLRPRLLKEQLLAMGSMRIYLIRQGNPKHTLEIERQLAKFKVNYSLVSFWKEGEVVYQTMVDKVLNMEELEIGNSVFEPLLNMADTFFDRLTPEQRDSYLQYGFFEDYNGYYVRKDDAAHEVSDFTMDPVAFVISDDNYRLFRITGRNEHSGASLVKIDKGLLTSCSQYKAFVDGVGPFSFTGTQHALDKLKSKWYAEMPSAIAIERLGWHGAGFWAYCNGVLLPNGEFTAVDNDSRVDVDGQTYFIPAASEAFRPNKHLDQDDLYQKDRLMEYRDGSSWDFEKWSSEFHLVFGNNGMVSLAWTVMAIMRDLIFDRHQKHVPIKFSYGPPSTGKSELDNAISDLFFSERESVDIGSATDPAFTKAPGLFSNAPCRFEEYGVGMPEDRNVMLKLFYDGNSKSKSHQTAKSKIITQKVTQAISVNGEHLPTHFAVSTRSVILLFDKKDYTVAESELFEKFNTRSKKGLGRVMADVLQAREALSENFAKAFKEARDELSDKLEGKRSEAGARLTNNYSVLLAVVESTRDVLKWPFEYFKFRDAIMSFLHRQLSMISNSSETGEFWKLFAGLVEERIIKYGVYVEVWPQKKSFKGFTSPKDKNRVLIKDDEWEDARDLVGIRLGYPYDILKKEYRQANGKAFMSEDDLRVYLVQDPAFVATCSAAAFSKGKRTSCLLFDHRKLKERGIDLDMPMSYDKERPKEVDQVPQGEKTGLTPGFNKWLEQIPENPRK